MGKVYDTKEYRCWQNMKDRVFNPNHQYFSKYSKLGVQAEWINDFSSFLSYIGMQPNSTTKWSVGRIDNTQGYFKGNIRWEDGYQQNRNRSKTSANNTGYTGVTWRTDKNRPNGRAIATWYNLNGKQESKSFSDKGVGKDVAIKAASEYRDSQITLLNELDAGYSEKHGK